LIGGDGGVYEKQEAQCCEEKGRVEEKIEERERERRDQNRKTLQKNGCNATRGGQKSKLKRGE
jgi:hypothetical protein